MRRHTFLTAAQAFVELVGRVPNDAWDRPALSDWDLRALVGHTSRALVTVVEYLAQPSDREELASPEAYLAQLHGTDPAIHRQVQERGVTAGRRLGTHPAAGVAQLLQEATMALMTVAADQDPLITTAFGGMRLNAYVPTRTFELVVHGLDVARAAQLDWRVPDEAMRSAVVLAARAATSNGQGARVLSALTGRSALPTGFSIV